MGLFNSDDDNSAGKLIFSVIILIILLITLSFVTFTLVYSIVSVDNNIFRTGSVSIDLNGGQPVIEAEDSNFAPGMTLEETFYIQNESTYSVYYKLYFRNLSGDMADVVEVTIYNGEEILYKGTPSSLTKEKVKAANDELLINERRELKIVFVFPEEAGNLIDNMLTFDLCADATQTKNNPEKFFD